MSFQHVSGVGARVKTDISEVIIEIIQMRDGGFLRSDCSFGTNKNQSYVLGDLDSYVQKNETRSPTYAIHENKLKMDKRLKYKL